MTLAPYLQQLGTWWGQSLLFVAAVIFFIWATRLEQEREQEEASKNASLIYRPGGSSEGKIGLPPPKPIPHHRWHWAKIGGLTCCVGFIVIGIAYAFQHHVSSRREQHQQSPPPRAQLQSSPVSRPTPNSSPSAGPKVSPHRTQKDVNQPIPQQNPPTAQRQSDTQAVPPPITLPSAQTFDLPGSSSVYGRVQSTVRELNEWSSNYVNRIQTIHNQVSMAARVSPGAQMNSDFQKQELARVEKARAQAEVDARDALRAADDQATNWMEAHKNSYSSLHQDAIGHMKRYKPNEWTINVVDEDQQLFNAAIKKADSQTPFADIEQDKMDMARFSPLLNYFTGLARKLREYPDD